MEDVSNLIPRTAPDGLEHWRPVVDNLKLYGLVYEAVYIRDYGGIENMLDEWAKPRKTKMVRVHCSCCGEERLMPWVKTDPSHGGYGFLLEDEETGDVGAVGSGYESICPICGAAVEVKKAAEISRGKGWFLADETTAVSASVVGEARYLVLTQWVIQHRVSRSGSMWVTSVPAESYVFAPEVCQKLSGWVTAYSGTCGYFIAYRDHWSQPQKWSETMGAVPEIFGLTPELIADSCLPNCKLDVYMDSFHNEQLKFPVQYLRLYQAHPNVENLLLNGLPMVLDDLLSENARSKDWEHNRKGMPVVDEILWKEVRPAQMLGLTKEELRLGQAQFWGAFHWRLFVKAKRCRERLTGEDIQNAHLLGDETALLLPGAGPVGKSLRYLLAQEATGEEWFLDDFEEAVAGDPIDVTTLLDYWRMCRECGWNLDDPQVRWPSGLIEAHDRASEAYEAKLTAEIHCHFRIRRRQLARYIFAANGMVISPAGSQRDLDRESEKLHHCVKTYGKRHASGETAIFFIRRKVEPNQPYFTLELDEKRLEVRQNRGMRNCGRTPDVRTFEDLWISWVRAGAKRDEDGRPVLAEKIQKGRSA